MNTEQAHWINTYFSVMHILESLIEVLDGIYLAELIHREPALSMELNELRYELTAVRAGVQ